jgi:predicted Zn-dependent protease
MNNEEVLSQLEKDLEHITSTPLGRRAFLSTIPLLLSSCATVTSDRYREGSNKGQKTSLTVRDEQKMTEDYLPKMQKDYVPYNSSFLQSYITQLGDKIVRANNLGGNPYSYNFTLVNSKTVNAFALPAGTVFVTGPLLAMASSEAELAGVIGHEIGHIEARHTAERIDHAKKEEKSTLLLGIGGLIGGAVLGYGISKALCRKKDKECMDRITKYGAMAGAAGGVLIQKYGFMANSREDEMEADRIGFRTSVKAGYHKNHVGRFYEKLLKMEEARPQKGNKALASFADAMSTHPPSRERVKQMKSMANKEKPSSTAKISSSDFNKAKSIVEKLLKA